MSSFQTVLSSPFAWVFLNRSIGIYKLSGSDIPALLHFESVPHEPPNYLLLKSLSLSKMHLYVRQNPAKNDMRDEASLHGLSDFPIWLARRYSRFVDIRYTPAMHYTCSTLDSSRNE